MAQRTYSGTAIDYTWDAAGRQLGTFQAGNGSWTGGGQIFWAGEREVGYYRPGAYFIHRTALGSNSMITDYAGNLANDVVFYPWGQVVSQSGDSWQNYFGAQERYEQDLGIYTPINRSYSPRLYRWLSPDPLGGDVTNPQSLNRYAYVMNNPTTLTDPLGLSFCDTHPDAPACSHEPGGPGPMGGIGFVDATGTPYPVCGMPPPLPPMPMPGGGGGSNGGGGSTGSADGSPGTIGNAFQQPSWSNIRCGLCKARCDLWLGIAASVTCGIPYGIAEAVIATINVPATIASNIGIEIGIHAISSVSLHKAAEKCAEKFAEKKKDCYATSCSAACSDSTMARLPF